MKNCVMSLEDFMRILVHAHDLKAVKERLRKAAFIEFEPGIERQLPSVCRVLLRHGRPDPG